MTFEINTRKATDILYAYTQGKKIYTARTEDVFVNNVGEIIYIENLVNYKPIGRVINNDRFQIGNVQYSFTN